MEFDIVLWLARFRASAQPYLASFFSLHYLVLFLTQSVLFYALTPRKWKSYMLLVISVGFFWLISGIYIVWLVLSTVSVWLAGILLSNLYARRDDAVKAAEKADRKAIKKAYQNRARWLLVLVVCLNIGILLRLKYSAFAAENLNALFGLQLEIPVYVMPIGISFYTLQAVSYIMDVYRGTISADRNLYRLALFMTFFPQIVEGPICRYSQTAEQLWNVGPITYDNLTGGLQRILYGAFKKIVVADRLNPLITAVFINYANYPGLWVFIGAACYTIQLYMDFSGSMDAVVGTARIFGVTMPENFRQPFASRTISEFWTRWHISLGTWFKDYLFYPITMSKPMKNLTSAARKKIGNHFGPLLAGSIALFCVWFCNGLWHGAAWSFIFFGMYHFAFILIGNIISPYVKSANHALHINADSLPYRLMQTFRTCVLVIFGELFFRAETLTDGMAMVGRLFTNFRLLNPGGQSLSELLFIMDLDPADFLIVLVTLAVVFAVSTMKERGISVQTSIRSRPIALRWTIWIALILYVLVFGAYGYGYIPVDPMYAVY